MSAQIDLLDGGRLHLNHGPIDLVISAEGGDVDAAYRQAAAVFPNILPDLVAELPVLRMPLGDARPHASGSIAARMIEATWPYRDAYVTPMAAVAGAVAEHVLAAMLNGTGLRKASVNNGGDIAFHLAPDARLRTAIVGDLAAPRIDAAIELSGGDPVRGIATSGWRGRSQSLGIADAVTVLARSAAEADAAATMIANMVDVEDPGIHRVPANQVRDDSDLGDIPVTVAVGPLSDEKITRALENGMRRANEIRARGLIVAAYLQLQGQMRVVGGTGLIAANKAA